MYLDEEVREGNEREEAKGLVGDGSWKSVTLFYLQKMSSYFFFRYGLLNLSSVVDLFVIWNDMEVQVACLIITTP